MKLKNKFRLPTILILILFFTGFSYFIISSRIAVEMGKIEDKARINTKMMAFINASSVWNMETDKIKENAGYLMDDKDLKAITIIDEKGTVIVEMKKDIKSENDIVVEEDMINDGKVIAKIKMTYTRNMMLNDMNNMTRDIVIFTVIMILCVTIVISIIANNVVKPIMEFINLLGEITKENNITLRGDFKSKDEIGEMGKYFNSFMDTIFAMITEIKSASENVASSSAEMSAEMNSISRTMQEELNKKSELENNFAEMREKMGTIMDNVRNQVAGVEEVSGSLAEISQTSNQVAKNADLTMKLSENTVTDAKVGGESVKKTLEGVSRIEEMVKDTEIKVMKLNDSSEEIGEIIKTIEEIAAQTNLLALNAAIEAAHAGEVGKGFAVVADEIKELAERSHDATKQIEKLINGIQNEVRIVIEATKKSYEEVRNSTELSQEAENKLKKIIVNIETTSVEVSNISKAMEEQAAAIQEITSAIQNVADGSANIEYQSSDQMEMINKAKGSLNRISEMIEVTTVSIEETSETSAQLSGLATNLESLVDRFVIEENINDTTEIKNR